MNSNNTITVKGKGRIPVYILLDNSAISAKDPQFLSRRTDLFLRLLSFMSTFDAMNGDDFPTPAIVSLISFGETADLLIPPRFLQERHIRGRCADVKNYLEVRNWLPFSNLPPHGGYNFENVLQLIKKCQKTFFMKEIDSAPLVIMITGSGICASSRSYDVSSLGGELSGSSFIAMKTGDFTSGFIGMQDVEESAIADKIGSAIKKHAAAVSNQFEENGTRIDLYSAVCPDACLDNFRSSSFTFDRNADPSRFCSVALDNGNVRMLFKNYSCKEGTQNITIVNDPWNQFQENIQFNLRPYDKDKANGMAFSLELSHGPDSKVISGATWILQLSFMNAGNEMEKFLIFGISVPPGSVAAVQPTAPQKKNSQTAAPKKKTGLIFAGLLILCIAGGAAWFLLRPQTEKTPSAAPEEPPEPRNSIVFAMNYNGCRLGPAPARLNASYEGRSDVLAWSVDPAMKHIAQITPDGYATPLMNGMAVFTVALKSDPSVRKSVKINCIVRPSKQMNENASSSSKDNPLPDDSSYNVFTARLNDNVRNSFLTDCGGDARTEQALERARRWLKSQQNRDGSWGYDNARKTELTCLALLVFLADRTTANSSYYAPVVWNGLTLLLPWCSDGNIILSPFDELTGLSWDTHLLVCIVLSQAFVVVNDPVLKSKVRNAAEKTCSILIQQINQRNINNDLASLALFYATSAGFDFNGLNSTYRRIFRQNISSVPHRFAVPNGRTSDFLFAAFSQALCAREKHRDIQRIASSLMLFSGKHHADSAFRADWNALLTHRGGIQSGAASYLLIRNWFLLTHAKFVISAPRNRDWTDWNQNFKQMLLENQSQNGAWCSAASDLDLTLWATVHFSLCLEVYYRYCLK